KINLLINICLRSQVVVAQVEEFPSEVGSYIDITARTFSQFADYNKVPSLRSSRECHWKTGDSSHKWLSCGSQQLRIINSHLPHLNALAGVGNTRVISRRNEVERRTEIT